MSQYFWADASDSEKYGWFPLLLLSCETSVSVRDNQGIRKLKVFQTSWKNFGISLSLTGYRPGSDSNIKHMVIAYGW